MIKVVILLGLLALCTANNLRTNYMFDGEKTFVNTAKADRPYTDKIAPHTYQKMYGAILLPMVEKFAYEKKTLKFLEIGLGCGMDYGPGASAKLWLKIFEGRDVDLWEAEFDEECVKKSREEGKLEGIKTVTGDQANPVVLKKWVQESGGHFDVIIDDGGHINNQVLNSFMALWPHVNPDGNYFIEDLQVAFWNNYTDQTYPPVTRVIQAWVEALHVGMKGVSEHHRALLARFPVPAGLDTILCQKEACVMHKSATRR